MDIPIKSIPGLLIEEVLTPFNIFQMFALILWGVDDYLPYAILIGSLTIIQITYELKELRENSKRIRSMILTEFQVTLIDGNKCSSTDLVPGD